MCHELDKGRVPEGFEEMLRYLEMIQIQYPFQLQIKKRLILDHHFRQESLTQAGQAN